jgi:membrane protease YdiL (CAAX protease family)
MLMVEAAALILMARFVREHHAVWSDAFGYRARPAYAILVGVLSALAFLPVAKLLQHASSVILLRLNWTPHEQEAVEMIRNSPQTLNHLALGLIAIVFAPIVEETFFRGILYPALKDAGFRHLAFWGSALLFAVIHLNAPTFLPLLALALMLTLLYEWTGNLLACILAHCAFNTINFLAILLQDRAMGPL